MRLFYYVCKGKAKGHRRRMGYKQHLAKSDRNKSFQKRWLTFESIHTTIPFLHSVTIVTFSSSLSLLMINE